MSELRIEEGKWYRRRDGAVVGPAWHRESGRLFPWCLGEHETTRTIYMDDGRFGPGGCRAELDLVREVTVPLPQNPVDIAIAAELDAETAGVPADTLPRRAVDIAGKAASLVGGDRDRQHGAKHDNFRRIAGVWNAWLAIRKEPAAPLDAHDVGCMMALMKLARTQSGALNVDDYVDACGYAACAGEVAQINET